jgi:pantetheine-phosphate adenylyltransferase
MTVALFPASFDPITSGHVDIATRASSLFDRLVVAVYSHPRKNVMFSLDERVDMASESLAHLSNVDVVAFSGLLVNLARQQGASIAVRGLRTTTDFEYEYQQAILNRSMYPGFDVVALFPSQQYGAVSSTMVKEIAENGGDVSGMVPAPVLLRLRSRGAHATPAAGG